MTARRERLPENFLSGVLYASDQTHHSVQKAALLAGFPPQNVRAIPSDGAFRLRVDALTQAIAADRTVGLTPFLIVGNAGTTNTGAVDDLNALADLAQQPEYKNFRVLYSGWCFCEFDFPIRIGTFYGQ